MPNGVLFFAEVFQETALNVWKKMEKALEHDSL